MERFGLVFGVQLSHRQIQFTNQYLSHHHQCILYIYILPEDVTEEYSYSTIYCYIVLGSIIDYYVVF